MRIDAQAAEVRIEGATILDRVDLSLGPNEIVGLIGPNGAGKSTLLKAMAGLLPLSGGAIRYDGRVDIMPAERARRLSYLAQDGDLHWPMRVEHIVALGRLPHRTAFAGESAEDRAAVERALALADVAQFRRRSAQSLSGGERMRVLLARALAVEAETLLADEPVAAVDALHQLRIMELLRGVAHAGKSVVVVLHDLALAARFCTRLVVLAKGRKILDGAPAELTDEVIREAYGVSTLRGEHEGQPFILPWAPLDR